MGAIPIKTVSIDEMEEATSLSETGSVILFQGNQAKIASLKALRQRVNPSPTLKVTAPEGTKVTVSNGEISLEGTGDEIIFDIPSYDDWNITAELNGVTKSQTLWIDTVKIYKLTITF